jgi:hypothetical protein
MTALDLRARRVRIAALLGAGLLLLPIVPGPALAAAPANDDIGTPTIVDTFPFSDGPIDTTEATTGATDPTFCFAEAGEAPDRATVWYSYTPAADGEFAVDTFGSDYDTTLYVGTDDGAGGIDVVSCVDDTVDLQSGLIVDGAAGTTYLIAVGTCCGGGVPGGGSQNGGGTLLLHVGEAPPPIEFELTLDPTATSSAYGTVTVHGTVTCANANGVGIDLGITQTKGRFTRNAFGFAELACDGTQPFEIQLASDDGRFRGGAVRAFAFGVACGSFGCAEQAIEAKLRLRN